MQLTLASQSGPPWKARAPRFLVKSLLIMKLTMLLLTIAMLQVQAAGLAQTVTLTLRNAPLEKVFAEIRKQTGYHFLYTDEQLSTAKKVNVQVRDAGLQEVLDQCFRDQPLTYTVSEKTIIVKRKPTPTPVAPVAFDNDMSPVPIVIKGKVLDDKGEPVAGATIQVKGTGKGVVTNENGEYEINVENTEAVLVISSLGFSEQEIPVKGRSAITVTLKAVPANMKELVVVGYGEQRKGTLTNAITTVSSASFRDQPVNRLDQILQGRAAGVQVTNVAGSPGGGVRIRIRGSNSINSDNGPLYVVDGFVGADFSSINPEDIESLQILKDASATALYGSRGANGVIIITTRKGTKGGMKVNFTARVYSSEVIKKIPLLGAGEFAETANAHATATGTTAPFTQAQIDEFKVKGGTNWQDEIFRRANGQEYLLSIAGGTDKTGYFISGNYLNQDGVIRNSYFKRYTLRSNVNGKLSEKISTFINILGTYSTQQNTDIPADGPHSPLAQAINWSPTVPVYNSMGGYTASDPVSSIFFNPVALTTDQLAVTERMLANVTGGFKYSNIVPGLSFTLQYGANYNGYENKNFAGKVVNSGTSTANLRSNKEIRLQNSNILHYKKVFNNAHNLDVTAVMEYQQNQYSYQYAGSSNLNYESFMWNNIGLATPGTPSSGKSKSALFSLVSRVNYGFKDKYLASAAIRRDGTSKFVGDNKYSYFPSGALGWVVSEEPFMQDIAFISTLKVRGSWGLTGNQGVDAYTTFSTYSNRVASFTNSTSQTGIILGNIGNPDLKWETTEQKNIGIDVGLWNGRVSVVADYFVKDTRDLLLDEKLPMYLGGNTITRNIGSMQNKGFEFAIEANVLEKGPLTWTTWFNATFVKNRVVSIGEREIIFDPNNRKIGGGMSPQSEFVVMPGQPMGAIWGLTYLGTWKPGDEGKAALFGANPGDARYFDKNGDNVIDADDYDVIGTGVPTTTLGWNNTVSYKGFSLNVFFYAALGFDKLNYNKAAAMYLGGDAREATHVDIKDRYIPGVNETSDIPAFSTTNKNFTQSTRFLESADYFRLKNISLSYDIPRKTFWGKAGVRVFVSATNLFTITNYTGIDPEANSSGGDFRQGIDYGSYPNTKTITGGCTISF